MPRKASPDDQNVRDHAALEVLRVELAHLDLDTPASAEELEALELLLGPDLHCIFSH